MEDKLKALEEKYRSLEASFSDPSLMNDPTEYARRMKEYRSLESPVQ